jgi:hypothetical protein
MQAVCFTHSCAPTNDGVAKVAETLARALRARGHTVTIFTMGSPGTPRCEVRGDGLRVQYLATGRLT